jgi:hypothetical protein
MAPSAGWYRSAGERGRRPVCLRQLAEESFLPQDGISGSVAGRVDEGDSCSAIATAHCQVGSYSPIIWPRPAASPLQALQPADVVLHARLERFRHNQNHGLIVVGGRGFSGEQFLVLPEEGVMSATPILAQRFLHSSPGVWQASATAAYVRPVAGAANTACRGLERGLPSRCPHRVRGGLIMVAAVIVSPSP